MIPIPVEDFLQNLKNAFTHTKNVKLINWGRISPFLLYDVISAKFYSFT